MQTDRQTDEQMDKRTLVIVESLSRLNILPDITESAEGTDEQNEIGSLSHAA